jgi:hypothetical protein
VSALAGRKRTRGPIKVLALEVGKNIEISGDRGEQLALVLTQPGDERSLPLWRVDPDKTSPEICEKLCVEDETTPVKMPVSAPRRTIAFPSTSGRTQESSAPRSSGSATYSCASSTEVAAAGARSRSSASPTPS